MFELKSNTYNFLSGDGEMAKLTRDFDWAASPVGPIDQWPQSLRTMTGVILHSQVPMLLFWGDDLIQLYNDAYRPSFGDQGKHPAALGQRGEECWPEIWHIIKPLIDTVRTGGATWSQNQLIPIYRNGRIEDVYWTFGYSPVMDDAGKVTGVLVICNETTAQVMSSRIIEESERTLRSIILHAPVGICIVDGDHFIVEVANDLYLDLVGKRRETFEGKPIWEELPEAADAYGGILAEVARTGVPYKGKEHRLLLNKYGKEEIVYVDFVYEPMQTGDSQASCKIMMLTIDVTDKVLARKMIEESELRYRKLITESTVAIALYIGPELRIQYVNQIMTGYWGRDLSVIGQTLGEAVPELKEQSFLEKLQKVYNTGESYTGTEEKAMLLVAGRLQPFYFNFIYKALRDTDGVIYGIHHMAMDVTEQVLARQKVERSEANLRNIILKAPVAMCILKGPEFIVEIANERMFALWGKQRSELLNRPIFSGLPEVKNQGFEEILARVFKTAQTFTAFAVPTALPRDGGVETVYINFVYEPYRDTEGNVSAIMAVATDVTEQVRAHQKVEELVAERTRALNESNKDLRRSNEELAQFAYIASHDLQEPARKIGTFTDMLKTNLPTADARSKNLMEKIEGASTRMLSLIRDILSYSQLAKTDKRYVLIDLNEVLADTKSDFELL